MGTSAMRQSQAEIKAIEAELRSIRADSRVTLLEPEQTANASSTTHLNPRQPIAPTIERQGQPGPQATSTRPAQAQSVRSVECFPFPSSYEFDQVEWQPASIASSTRKQSARTSNSAARKTTQRTSRTPQLNQARYLLAEKASQINALANQQEAIILELISLSDQLEPELEPVCEYDLAEIPYVETDDSGTLLLTSRALDLSWLDQGNRRSRRGLHRVAFGLVGGLIGGLVGLVSLIWQAAWALLGALLRALLKLVVAIGKVLTMPLKWLLGQSGSRQAARTAQTMDQTGHNFDHLFDQGFDQADYVSSQAFDQTPSQSKRHYRGSGRRLEKPFTLTEAALLVLGSALLRYGLDWLVGLYPVLWLPSLLVMLTPAAIAVYRATVIPKTGFAWGYRLFAIMIGLLLGGRL
jgi:hypothetical protein